MFLDVKYAILPLLSQKVHIFFYAIVSFPLRFHISSTSLRIVFVSLNKIGNEISQDGLCLPFSLTRMSKRKRYYALMSPLGNAMQMQCSKTLVRIYRIYRRFFGNCDLLQTIKTRYKRIALCFVRE